MRASHSETEIRVGFVYTAVSRKVVGKSARDKPERYCGRFWVHCFLKKVLKNYTRGHGSIVASAKGKQEK